MILVTVGTQLPFDRLIKAVDEIAPSLSCKVVAQIGEGRYHPRNIEAKKFIAPVTFDKLFDATHLVVSHAGIGSVLTARRHGKPIILFPRRAAYGEHRNDHQLATISQLEGQPGIYIAHSEQDLAELMAKPLSASFMNSEMLATAHLKDYLRNFIQTAR